MYLKTAQEYSQKLYLLKKFGLFLSQIIFHKQCSIHQTSWRSAHTETRPVTFPTGIPLPSGLVTKRDSDTTILGFSKVQCKYLSEVPARIFDSGLLFATLTKMEGTVVKGLEWRESGVRCWHDPLGKGHFRVRPRRIWETSECSKGSGPWN